MERLHVFLARAGIDSRRRCEELIRAGRVKVNGQTVSRLGMTVHPDRDRVEVDGRRVAREPLVYYLLHKPPGYVSTARDPQGRPTVLELVPKGPRLYPVGRLDAESEGLLLLTNDGELCNRLTHPRYQHEREYRVQVRGVPSADKLRALRAGLSIEGRLSRISRVSILEARPERAWLRIVLREGRKRQIRQMLQAVGHPVLRLIRVRFGPLELGELRRGRSRPLRRKEIALLWQAARIADGS